MFPVDLRTYTQLATVYRVLILSIHPNEDIQIIFLMTQQWYIPIKYVCLLSTVTET